MCIQCMFMSGICFHIVYVGDLNLSGLLITLPLTLLTRGDFTVSQVDCGIVSAACSEFGDVLSVQFGGVLTGGSVST